MLSMAMEDMDVDKADEIMEKLMEFQYGEEAREVIERLQAAVKGLDSDTVEELTSRLIGKGMAL